MAIDLMQISAPDVIESLDYEHIRSDKVKAFKERWEQVRVLFPELPTYDVELLETDPVLILLEVASYIELHLRARINDAAKANLLLFARGADLDHLAAFYDVTRLDNEGDEALRSRTVLSIQARSPGGSSYWYAAAAHRADVRIKSVSVYREKFWPIIHIAVLSNDDDGIPDQAMLDAVSAEVMRDDVRLLNDTIIVEAAVTSGIPIEADVWLLPTAPTEVIDQLPSVLRAAWDSESGIGFDLEQSWIRARLHVPGVKKVEVINPSDSVVVSGSDAVAIGNIKINYRGRDY